MPELSELLDGLRVVSLPMRVRFRGILVREAALLRGPNGWTEFSPFLEYDDAEAANWLAAAIEYGWGAPHERVRDRIAINATVPAVPASDVPEVLALFGRTPPDTVKVKVAQAGQSVAEDLSRLDRIHEILPEARIRVDANAGWSLDEAKRALDAFAGFSLEYVEQPVADVDGLRALREWSRTAGPGTLIAADESIRKAADPLRVAREGAADVVVVKAQPLGGIARAARIVAECGLPAVVSSALDTAVGIGMGLELAAALPSLPFACGLGTGRLFQRDVAAAEDASPWLRAVRRAEPTAATIRSCAAAPERARWWRERIERCFPLLAV